VRGSRELLGNRSATSGAPGTWRSEVRPIARPAAGMEEYISKPIGLNEWAAVIARNTVSASAYPVITPR
jgi:hypothetical protein